MKINRVLFVGSKQLGLTCLKAMFNSAPQQLIAVMTIDDSSDIRTRYEDFVSFCSEHNLPLYTANNRSHSENIILDVSPEICFFVGWYWLIGEAVLNQVPFGCLGIHNSLLPKYRGSSPLVWSIMNNDSEVGFSVFSFTPEMDEGDIWFQYSTELKDEDTVNSVLNRLDLAAYNFFKNSLVNLLSGKIKPVPQNHELATYCSQRTPEDGIVDWSKPAIQVVNFIRALTIPYPGAFTHFQDKKLTILSAENLKVVYYGYPGQVARVNDRGVTVVCGQNTAVLIKKVIFNGFTCNAQDVVRSIKTRF